MLAPCSTRSSPRGSTSSRRRRTSASSPRLVAGNDALQRVLTNPAIPVARKRACHRASSSSRASLQPTVAKLLLMLAERDRLVILPDVADVFDARLMEHQNVVRARIVTAVALPSDRVTALAAGLTRATGRNVRDRNAGGPGASSVAPWRASAARSTTAASPGSSSGYAKRSPARPTSVGASSPSAARSRRARASGGARLRWSRAEAQLRRGLAVARMG